MILLALASITHAFAAPFDPHAACQRVGHMPTTRIVCCDNHAARLDPARAVLGEREDGPSSDATVDVPGTVHVDPFAPGILPQRSGAFGAPHVLAFLAPLRI
jgi:hypothetical protein